MKLTILGTSAAFAGKGEGCSSYLLAVDRKNYLIDTGPGCVSSLQNYIRYTDLSGIFLSHLHADHSSDIYTLRYAVYIAQNEGKMQNPLPIYMPNSPKREYKFVRDNIKEEFLITQITDKLSLDLDGLKVSFQKTEHSIKAFAIKFEYSDKSVVYTADTGYFKKLVDFCYGAQILIAEATFQNTEKELENLGHMTAERAAELAKEARAERLLLTHIMPYYEKQISLEEAKKIFPDKVSVAAGGQEYVL
jgi:ribonuclease BN (tRNA processing enzyme)